MSITDELRNEVFHAPMEPDQRGRFIAIANRIEAEHVGAQRRWMAELDAARDRDGYIALPKDADGEYIHVGDMMDTEHFGTVEVEGFIHNAVAFYNYSGQPAYLCTSPANLCHHHHEPTVEDVMVEFATDWESAQDGEDKTAVLKEYAAKLRLAGEDE